MKHIPLIFIIYALVPTLLLSFSLLLQPLFEKKSIYDDLEIEM